MITFDQFMMLGAGDVIIWRWMSPSPVLRTVIEGPRDDMRPNPHASISLPIRSRSWTGRAHTTRGWNDVKHIISYTGKTTNTLFSPDELDRILALKLKPKWDALWMIDCRKRTGHRCSDRLRDLMADAIESFRFANIK